MNLVEAKLPKLNEQTIEVEDDDSKNYTTDYHEAHSFEVKCELMVKIL